MDEHLIELTMNRYKEFYETFIIEMIFFDPGRRSATEILILIFVEGLRNP